MWWRRFNISSPRTIYQVPSDTNYTIISSILISFIFTQRICMKSIIILAILFAIGLIFFFYKRENNTQKMLLSFVFLAGIITWGIIGNTLHSIVPLFLTHLVALIASYTALLIYIFRDKFYWYIALLPMATLSLYLLLAFVGNRHL